MTPDWRGIAAHAREAGRLREAVPGVESVP